MKLMQIKKFFQNLSKKQKIIASVLLLLTLFFVFRGGEEKEEKVLVEMGVIEQEVLATGKLKPSQSVDLAFERSGRISLANVSVGSSVRQGETLALLDQGELLANLRKAEASLRESEIALAQVRRTAPSSFSSAYSTALSSLTDAYTESSNAVYNVADRFFQNVTTGSPTLVVSYISNGAVYTFTVADDIKRQVANRRSEISIPLSNWKTSLDKLKGSGGDLSSSFAEAEANLVRVKILLADLSAALGSITSYDYSYESILAGYKTSVSTAQSSVNATLTALISAKDRYVSAPQEASLSGISSFDSVLAQEAKVEAVRADVASYKAQLAKTVIYSPIDGVVTKQDAKLGEIVTAGETLISVISNKELEIEANISEVNIGKVSVGNSVRITLDAAPDVTLLGVVSYIDPGESNLNGVVNYKVRINFTDIVPEWVKTGLTANLRIETMRKEGVLKIPSYAVSRRGEKAFVKVYKGGELVESEVVTGLIGKDGTIEVVSGLLAGETVIIAK